MINEKIIFGFPENFKDVCLIYPPKNKDIISIGYEIFCRYYTSLTISYEDLYDILRKKSLKENKKFKKEDIPSTFDSLWIQIKNDKNEYRVIKEAIKFFTKSDVFFLEEKKEIIIGPIEEHRSINKDNFFDFQNMIRISIGAKEKDLPNISENFKISEMKAKARERDRIKAKKESKDFDYIIELLTLCCMNVGIDINNILEQTYALTNLLFKMSIRKEKYNLDINSILAGADSKKIKIQDWKRNPNIED